MIQENQVIGSPLKNPDIKTPLVVSFSLGVVFIFATSGVLMSGFFKELLLVENSRWHDSRWYDSERLPQNREMFAT